VIRSNPRWSRLAPALVVTLVLSACSWTPEQVGTAAGAIAGCVVGHLVARGNPIGMIGGAAAGGVLGHELAKTNDEAFAP